MISCFFATIPPFQSIKCKDLLNITIVDDNRTFRYSAFVCHSHKICQQVISDHSAPGIFGFPAIFLHVADLIDGIPAKHDNKQLKEVGVHLTGRREGRQSQAVKQSGKKLVNQSGSF